MLVILANLKNAGPKLRSAIIHIHLVHKLQKIASNAIRFFSNFKSPVGSPCRLEISFATVCIDINILTDTFFCKIFHKVIVYMHNLIAKTPVCIYLKYKIYSSYFGQSQGDISFFLYIEHPRKIPAADPQLMVPCDL